tara:strand:- start:32 stop:175 length:144 start_codon:yes stop_codon:yes gene_type:complete
MFFITLDNIFAADEGATEAEATEQAKQFFIKLLQKHAGDVTWQIDEE